MASTVDPQKRAEIELQAAELVAATLEEHGWLTLPKRPLSVDAKDLDLIRWHEAREAGQQLTKAESKQLLQLGRWAAAVTMAEAKTGQRLTTLLWSAETLHREKHAEFDSVAAFIAEEYSVTVPPFLDQWEREQLVQRQCQDLKLLPGWLRRMERPTKREQEAF